MVTLKLDGQDYCRVPVDFPKILFWLLPLLFLCWCFHLSELTTGLHSGKHILLGTVITKQQAKYPFRNAAYAEKMLVPTTGSRNRLMRLYKRLGFIPVGDNEVVLVTPKAYSTYLNNMDDLIPVKPHFQNIRRIVKRNGRK